MGESLSKCRRAGVASLLLTALLVSAAAAADESKSERPAPSETGKQPVVAPVDLNRATAEGLTAVPGIGKTMAERIVAWREAHGPFRRVEDLMKVKGIGEKSLEKLRPYVKVSKGT